MEPNGILISSLASLMSLSQHFQLHLLASYTFNRDGVTESFVGRLNSELRKQLLPLGSTVYERFNSMSFEAELVAGINDEESQERLQRNKE